MFPKWIKHPMFLLMAIFFMLLPLYYPIYRQVEGNVLPVIKDVSLSPLTEVEETKEIIVSMEFTKARQCDFVELQAYVGLRGDRVYRVPMYRITGKSVNLPTGNFKVIGEWAIATSEPFESVFIDAIHRCHPFWETRTRFWK